MPNWNEVLQEVTKSKNHGRHLNFEDCLDMGLNVIQLEKDNILQDLVFTVHHCYMHSLSNTSAFKMIENHLGVAYVKHQVT